ncbi:MAG: cache domain-containing protein, partial [Nitrospirae bacterium]|nr:cache domain-containing protein [Nitrospirota bacterium]
MSNLKTKHKLAILVIFAVISMILLTAGFMYSLNRTLLEDKKGKIRNVVESVYGILEHYGSLADSGGLTQDAAKEAAKVEIKKLRYDEKEYFWINDDKSPFPTMIMHP